MSGLDDKLREIIDGYSNHQDTRRYSAPEATPDYDWLEAITLIKQTFADAGWIGPNKAKSLYNGMLDGQEWYDRFMEEMDAGGEWLIVGHAVIEEAAKRAAGYGDDKENTQ